MNTSSQVNQHDRVTHLLPGGTSRSCLGFGLAIPLLVATVYSAATARQSEKPAATGERISFNQTIRPLLQQHCSACHGGVKAAGGISFVYKDRAFGKGDSGEPIIVAGHPEESELIRRVTAHDEEERMPPAKHGVKLSAAQIQTLESWISQGAPWDELWSIQQLQEPPAPALERPTTWGIQPLDAFVAAGWEQAGLSPSPPAKPAEWLRRVSFDLIGLPPTLEEYRTFQDAVTQGEPQAKEQVIDRLLQSPQFGERWASLWMDLARYSDTHGFEQDPARTIWPWRDWVVRAFNCDMPYDQFTIRQIAGDLLDEPSTDDVLATAFHRNTQNNAEGGTDDEEFRLAAVIDRVDTLWTTWQGTTFGCARCHAHPYDPYPQADYFRMLAFFNNTEDADLNDDFPVFTVPDAPEARAQAVKLRETMNRERNAVLNSGHKVLTATSDWAVLTPLSASASAGSLDSDEQGTIRASGTLPVGVSYSISFPVNRPLTALQLFILPDDPSPDRNPERAAVLSHLVATQILKSGERKPLSFGDVVADYLAGPFDPRESLNENAAGFGEFPVTTSDRMAVFVLNEPLSTEAVTIELVMHQKAGANSGFQAAPVRQFQWQGTADPKWTDWLNGAERAEFENAFTTARQAYQAAAGPRVPVLRERRPEAARRTRILARGNRMAPGAEVKPGLPGPFRAPGSNPEPVPTMSRLDLANWLVSHQNPLTARTLANRLWAELFGTGIVETLEDLGTSGAEPSNAKLLDHLAFRLSHEHRWSLKAFLKEVTLSATYGQTATSTDTTPLPDPRNRMVARGPRKRLSAEMIRDQALAMSGLLSAKMYGPPVFPPQPDGVWNTVYSGATWKTSEGEDRYRRALYTYQKRTSGYPAFLTFDAPTRDVCTARRIPTNTPLQALLTLNDPALLECAQALATRAASQSPDPKQQISYAAQLWTLESPAAGMIERLIQLREEALMEYSRDPEASRAIADSPERAALVLVCHALFNLDLALNR